MQYRDLNMVGLVLQTMLLDRGIEGPSELTSLLNDAGFDFSEEEVIMYMFAPREQHPRPRVFANGLREVLDLSEEETGELALAWVFPERVFKPPTDV